MIKFRDRSISFNFEIDSEDSVFKPTFKLRHSEINVQKKSISTTETVDEYFRPICLSCVVIIFLSQNIFKNFILLLKPNQGETSEDQGNELKAERHSKYMVVIQVNTA